MSRKEAFWNRDLELSTIKRRISKGGFGYVTGRRRIGKTALLREACGRFHGIYHQAVEGTPEQQLIHLAEELSGALPIFRDVVPKNWNEFFRLLSKERLPKLVVFDEFPYWASADASVSSLFQKWIDHDLPKLKTLVVVSGSSQSMLYSEFLDETSPLFGRASFHLHMEPMEFGWFTRALGYKKSDPLSFTRFSLVGGVPHYWKLMPKGSVTRQTDELYFSPSAILAEEPIHWIRDEGITGNLPKAILDLVGRGVRKPSELASRLGMPQGNLTRPLALLIDLGLMHRELPFGESTHSTKKVIYRIHDPALSFYYGVCLPNRSRWSLLASREKTNLIERHASVCWEDFCRSHYPGSGRYWEGDVEIDLVAPAKGKKSCLIAECKWKWLGQAEEKKLLEALKAKFSRTRLARKLSKVSFRIFSKQDLAKLPLS